MTRSKQDFLQCKINVEVISVHVTDLLTLLITYYQYRLICWTLSNICSGLRTSTSVGQHLCGHVALCLPSLQLWRWWGAPGWCRAPSRDPRGARCPSLGLASPWNGRGCRSAPESGSNTRTSTGGRRGRWPRRPVTGGAPGASFRPYLSRVPELGGHGSAHRLVDISAVEHDEGGVAAQLHGRLLHSVSSHFQQHLRGGTS